MAVLLVRFYETQTRNFYGSFSVLSWRIDIYEGYGRGVSGPEGLLLSQGRSQRSFYLKVADLSG